jgi:hypothetical protein
VGRKAISQEAEEAAEKVGRKMKCVPSAAKAGGVYNTYVRVKPVPFKAKARTLQG